MKHCQIGAAETRPALSLGALMIRLSFPLFGLSLALLLTPAPIRAAENSKAQPPLLTVRVRDLQGLANDLQYLAKAAGMEKEAGQIDDFYRAAIVDKGVDVKRAWGGYGRLGDELTDSPVVVMLPVSDQNAILKLLAQFKIATEKGENGIYKLEVPGVSLPVFLRFKNKYAYVTIKNKIALDDGELLDADTILAGNVGILTAELNIDRVTATWQDRIVKNLDEFSASMIKNSGKSVDPITDETGIYCLTGLAESAKNVTKEGSHAVVHVELDQKTGPTCPGSKP